MNIYMYVIDRTSDFALVKINIEDKVKRQLTVSSDDVLKYRMTMRDIIEGKARDLAASYFSNKPESFDIVWGNTL